MTHESASRNVKLSREPSTVYGPVPSWRLGRSLGVDVVQPPKVCTFDCIYCQLGRTRTQVSRPEEVHRRLVDAKRVGRDLDNVLKRLDLDTVDAVTFSGTGEPTLNPELGRIAKAVKEKIGDVPMVVLTNSSLLRKKRVRDKLTVFDLVVAKLDAGDDATFRAINRPAIDTTLTASKIVNSIKELKRTAHGAVALEVMLLSSADSRVSNVQGKTAQKLVDAIVDVDPDQVQLEVPYRPPSESYVKTPLRKEITQVAEKLARHFERDRLRIFGLESKHRQTVRWLVHKSLESEVIELLKRRPCGTSDVSRSLGITLAAAGTLLKKLVEEGIATVETRGGEKYHCIRTSS